MRIDDSMFGKLAIASRLLPHVFAQSLILHLYPLARSFTSCQDISPTQILREMEKWTARELWENLPRPHGDIPSVGPWSLCSQRFVSTLA